MNLNARAKQTAPATVKNKLRLGLASFLFHPTVARIATSVGRKNAERIFTSRRLADYEPSLIVGYGSITGSVRAHYAVEGGGQSIRQTGQRGII